MDPNLRALIFFAAACATLILAMLALMVSIRLLSAAGTRRYRLKEKAWEAAFLEYLQGSSGRQETAARFGRPGNYTWLWFFFRPYLEMLEGDDFDKTAKLCSELGLTLHYRAKLHSYFGGSRVLAASVMATLRDRDSIPELKAMLRSRNPLLVQAAARALVRAGQFEALPTVTAALLRNTYFTFEGATEILTGFGPESCETIAGELALTGPQLRAETSGKVKARGGKGDKFSPSVYASILVDLLGFFRYREALPVMAEMLDYADYETTVHILKAFQRMGETPSGFDAAVFLEHPYWVVRSFAARLFNLGSPQAGPSALEKALGDRHWWVRFHAAEALAGTGTEGLSILRRRAAGPEGPQAGISRYILVRKGEYS